MRTSIKSVALVVFSLLISIVALPAFAEVIYTNTPWEDGGGPCIGANGANATGVAVMTPAGISYSVSSILMSAHDVGVPSDVDVRLYSDNAGAWDAEIASFGVQSGIGGGDIATLEFTPASPVQLQPSTVYWVVATVMNEADTCAVGWNDDGSAPSGVLTYVDAIQVFNGSSNQRDSSVTLVINSGGAAASNVAVPALGNWGLILAILLLAASGALLMRRLH